MGSVALTLNVNEPTAVGVPEITPFVDSDRPGSNTPGVDPIAKANLKGKVVPLTVRL